MDGPKELDAVMENINLLIEDMEDSLKMTKKSKSLFKAPTSAAVKNKETVKEQREKMPIIRHEFTNQSTGTFDEFDSTHVIAYDNASHFDELIKAKDAIDSAQTKYNNRKLSVNGKRLCYSAENSPVMSRSMMGKQNSSNSQKNFQRTNSITPRLEIDNIDKFDVAVKCPDESLFKAGVFKAWTAFQLAWKIAHVRGMKEKIALVIEEYITDLHLKRQIEDHEKIYKVTTNWATDSKNILVMNERITKYNLFNEPADYLPIEMLDTKSGDETLKTPKEIRRSFLLKSIMTADKTPNLQGWVFVKDFDKRTWKKRFLRIKDRKVFICVSDDENEADVKEIYTCNNSFLYNCLPEFEEAHKAPLNYCFCLIPQVVTSWEEIKCFCTSSEKYLVGWTSGFRLAKYSQQLYTNFREAMSKEANLRRTNSARVSLLYRRSFDDTSETKENKATIDFSGENGRIISDPKEALKIESELGFEIPKSTKRRSGSSFTSTSPRNDVINSKAWYHGKLEREEAIRRLNKYGAKEGMFLVRESSSSHGNLVLTVVNKKGRPCHLKIAQNKNLFGIELGPQFNSLELLIEAYHSGAVEGAEFNLKKPCPVS